jgi:hypothetical protein
VTLPSVFGCQVCSTLEKQNVPKSKVFFGAKCASANALAQNEKLPLIWLNIYKNSTRFALKVCKQFFLLKWSL